MFSQDMKTVDWIRGHVDAENWWFHTLASIRQHIIGWI